MGRKIEWDDEFPSMTMSSAFQRSPLERGELKVEYAGGHGTFLGRVCSITGSLL